MPRPERLSRAVGAAARRIACGLEIAALGICAAWLIGRLASDRYVWSQLLLWLPTPLVLLSVVIAFLAALRRAEGTRRAGPRRVTWAVLAALLLVHFTLREHRFLRAAPPTNDTYSLMHWNMTDAWYATPEVFADRLVEERADIVVTTNAGRVLAEPALREWNLQRNRFVAGRFMLATRFEIVGRRWLVATGGIHIYRVVLDTPGERDIALHLVDLPSDPRRSRTELASSVARLLEEQGSPAADVLVGDFNITRGAASLARITRGFAHAYDRAGHGYGVSYHRWSPFFHIDHVFVGPDVPLVRYDLIDPGFGQHFIQTAHFALPAGGP